MARIISKTKTVRTEYALLDKGTVRVRDSTRQKAPPKKPDKKGFFARNNKKKDSWTEIADRLDEYADQTEKQ